MEKSASTGATLKGRKVIYTTDDQSGLLGKTGKIIDVRSSYVALVLWDQDDFFVPKVHSGVFLRDLKPTQVVRRTLV